MASLQLSKCYFFINYFTDTQKLQYVLITNTYMVGAFAIKKISLYLPNLGVDA